MASLFRQSLSDLRQRFAAGAERHPELRCVMAQTTDLEGDSDHLLQCARAFDLGEPASYEAAFWWEVRSGEYERLGGKRLRVRVVKPATYWHIQYCGDEEGSRLFTALAEQASECLPPRVHPAFCRLPKGFRDGGATGAKRWLFLVFHLAWSGTDSTPLHACRHRGDPGRQHANDDSGPFWSALLTDPFQASVAAIDILLAHVPDDDFDPYRELVHKCDWYIDQIVTPMPQRDVRDWAGLVGRLWGQARLIGGGGGDRSSRVYRFNPGGRSRGARLAEGMGRIAIGAATRGNQDAKKETRAAASVHALRRHATQGLRGEWLGGEGFR
jgi:hypothetical protein